MRSEGERKLILERVLDEFNNFEGCATNHKYQLGVTYKNVLINILVFCTPKAFQKLQRIHDTLPPNLSPVTIDALASQNWILGALPKGLKAEDAITPGPSSSGGATLGQKTQWRDSMKMSASGQELLMDRLGVLCTVAARKAKAGTRSTCVVDAAMFEDESLYMRWAAYGIKQLELVQKAHAESSDKSPEVTVADVTRRVLEGAYKDTFIGLWMMKEPFDYRWGINKQVQKLMFANFLA